MKILIDAIPMTGLLTGIARYLRNLYSTMDLIDSVKLSYFDGKKLFHSMPPIADPEKWQKTNGAIRKLPDPMVFSLQALHWLKYENTLNRICRKKSFDIYHETAFVPAKLISTPSIYSMYDLSLRHYAETHPRDRVWFFEYFIKKRLACASHILTISEFIRQEIIAEFKVPPEMVTAIPLAPDPMFSPCNEADVRNIKAKYNLPESYLLFVGILEPRKNINLLIDAMEKADSDISLVLVGWNGWGDKSWMDKIQKKGLAHRIVMTGYLPDEDLKEVYSGATALVYPSLYEGFGLPIVEAMACGCPVICSNTASMPEVAGNAAILIDPFSSDELAEGLEKISNDTEFRQNLMKKGLAQAASFKWEVTARETLELFQRVAN